jgi:hypothetical protein
VQRLISRVIGADGREVMTRIMGYLLVCIGVQFIASGIRSFPHECLKRKDQTRAPAHVGAAGLKYQVGLCGGA